MALAWVGLIEFLPVLFLSLLAGQTADRFPRKTILLMSHALIGLSSVALMLLSAYHGPGGGILCGVGLQRIGLDVSISGAGLVYAPAGPE